MIHAYKMHGENIVLDVNSGAVHVLDDTAYDVLNCYSQDGIIDEEKLQSLRAKYNAENLLEARQEIDHLKENDMLFTADPYEEYLPKWTKKTVIKALCLHIAHDCNLRCSYCFAGTGEYSGARSLMSLEVGKKAIDFLIENSGSRKNLEVDFFGGEPLMNFEVLKALVAYGRKAAQGLGKVFNFTLTTNGVLLTEEVPR